MTVSDQFFTELVVYFGIRNSYGKWVDTDHKTFNTRNLYELMDQELAVELSASFLRV
jgi:hypothetical protein